MADIRRSSGSQGTGAVIYDFSQARERAATRAESTPEPVDSSGISEGARELARARAAVEAARETRAERVRQLKAQIERGEYHPDPHEVARKILEHGL
ncbi:MAG: flagellar biosynthesis anti-sigma factor FlgM [Hyphomicrobiales bacterium]